MSKSIIDRFSDKKEVKAQKKVDFNELPEGFKDSLVETIGEVVEYSDLVECYVENSYDTIKSWAEDHLESLSEPEDAEEIKELERLFDLKKNE